LIVTFTPLLFLYLTFLEHFVYLKNIQGVLLVASLLGTAYLQYSFYERSKNKPTQDSGSAPQEEAFPLCATQFDKTSLLVLALSILIYILYASGLVFPAHPITGDEPHYLLITHSLVSDGDINLFNNYKDRDYLQFYPGELDSHARPGKKGFGYEYSKHTPGLALLLVPSYFTGKILGGIAANLTHNPALQQRILILAVHVFMGLMTAFLCWTFFLIARDFTKNQNSALICWFLLSLTSPILFYSHLIYPEIPAALIMILILHRSLFSKQASLFSLLWVGFGIALLPWLGVKYLVLSAGLFGVVFIRFWKSDRMRGKNTILFLTPLFISSGLFLFYLYTLYGNIYPASIYKGSLPPGSSLSLKIFHFKFGEYFRCGLSYFFDQRIGLFPYSPIYMIFLPGVILSFVREKGRTLAFFGMFFLYWGFCSSAYYWGGYCPPGRVLLPVVFILAFFVAAALTWGNKSFTLSVWRILIFLSLGIAFICVRNPRQLYHEELTAIDSLGGIYSNLLTSLSNSFVNFRILVPSLVNSHQILWTPLIFWMSALLLFCFLFLKKENKAFFAQRGLGNPIMAVFLLSILLVAYTFFDIHLDRAHLFKDKPYKLYFQDTSNFGQELDGFWTQGQEATEILVETETRASKIQVKLSSPMPGRAAVRVGRKKHLISHSLKEGQKQTLSVPDPVGFPLRSGYLYSIRIQEHNGFHPFRLDPGTQDSRFLGVFVEIDVELDKKNQARIP
jgi:hypothetical protein